MTETQYQYALWFIVGFGAITFPILFFITAPYGRHFRKGWGPTIPAKLAWVLMEAPSPICFALVFFQHERSGDLVPLIFFGLWQLHYVYRSFIFPFRMRGSGKRKPVFTVAMAFLFNIANGAINGYGVTVLGAHLTMSWLSDPRFIAGIAVFFIGWFINHQSDHILRNLRAPGESGYKIPRGGMYRFISSPNYFGEIVEWIGYALASWVVPGAAFAFFTFANLAPRAVSHHKWYQEKFEDYPRERRAIVPYVW